MKEAPAPGSKEDIRAMANALKTAADFLRDAREKEALREKWLLHRLRQWLACHEKASVAKRIGVSPQFLSDIDRGRRKISPQFLEKLITYANEMEAEYAG